MKMESNLPPYPCTWNGSGKYRGAALVLNYKFEGSNGERKGSEFDVQRMTRVLGNLGYKVSSFGNLSYEDTEKELRKFKDDRIHSEDTTDSTIVCIMSHGDSGSDLSGTFFETDDGKLMGSQVVIDLFDCKNAPDLKGKPKLFFFNFCRGPLPGNFREKSARKLLRLHKKTVGKYCSEAAETNALPASKGGRDCNDTLIVFASLPRAYEYVKRYFLSQTMLEAGFVAFRYESQGTVFIQALCEVLEDREQIAQKHIELLLKQVDEKVKLKLREAEKSDDFESQTVEKVNRGFNREFYFLSFHKLRSYYLDNLCQVKPLPWSTQFNWSIEEIYTPLVVADAHQSGASFPHEELISRLEERFPHGSGYRCLIEGNPGYGKSTLMLKLTSDWTKLSSGNYLSRFRLVLLVKLVEVGEEGNLENRICELYKDKIALATGSNVFESESSEQVLVLLDGYDEANENTKESVRKIMVKESWSQCHLVLTSRFGNVTDDLKSQALCAKLEGFQKGDVELAVVKFFIKAGYVTKDAVNSLNSLCITKDDFKNVTAKKGILSEAKRLSNKKLEEFIRKLLYETPYCDLAKCPLLCFMLCCLVTEFPDSNLPESKTELYFAIINRNLYRAAYRKAPPGKFNEKWNWDKLKSKFHKDHENNLKEFGRLCLEYIQNISPHFTLFELTGDDDTCDPNHPEVIRLLEAGVIVEGDSNSGFPVYHPVHRTMAEFLAAYYLTLEEDDRKVECHVVMLFLKGASLTQICRFCYELCEGEGEIIKMAQGLPCRINTQDNCNKEVACEFDERGFAVRTKDSHAYYVLNVGAPDIYFAFENLAAASAWNDLSQLLRKCLEHKTKLYGISVTSLGLTGTQNSYLAAVAHDECVRNLKSLIGSSSCPRVMRLNVKETEPSVEKAEDGVKTQEGLLSLLTAFQDPPETCHLSELCLKSFLLEGEALDSFVHSILNSRLQSLYLYSGSLTFVTSQLKTMSKFAAGTSFRLRYIDLRGTQLILRDPEAFDLDPALFPLERLYIDDCQFTPKLFDWLASSVRKVRDLLLHQIPPGVWHAESKAWQLFSSNNGNTLQDVSLSFDQVSFSSNGNLLHSLQDTIPQYSRLEWVKILGLRKLTETSETHGFPDESLTCLQEKILKLPQLRRLNFPPYGNTFFKALANMAYKWTGDFGTKLMLQDLSKDEEAQMARFFQERHLNYCRESDDIWFPEQRSPLKVYRHLSS